MKFVKDQLSNETLDLIYRMCPLHLLEPGYKLKCMKKGQALEVLADYDGPWRISRISAKSVVMNL
jgi:TusA-related sulfurtransferase